MKKFELTTDSIKRNGVTLYRIKALIDFEDVKAGDLGGYVEKEENLSQSGNAWVYGNAEVSGDACVSGDADYIYLKGFGSHNRSTTMFRAKGGNICVSCGCFSGTLEEFESKVKETHGSNKFAREYLALVEAAKIHFEV
ncbi:MAG: hypothetical protein MSA74_01150 [Ruminococcus sp.]|nr:hypothetical protein [Ruminococcus sp.]